MKIEYGFLSGENLSVEVYGEFEKIMIKIKNKLKNLNFKEIRTNNSIILVDKNSKNTNIKMDVFEKFSKYNLCATAAKLEPQEQDLLYKLYRDIKSIVKINKFMKGTSYISEIKSTNIGGKVLNYHIQFYSNNVLTNSKTLCKKKIMEMHSKDKLESGIFMEIYTTMYLVKYSD